MPSACAAGIARQTWIRMAYVTRRKGDVRSFGRAITIPLRSSTTARASSSAVWGARTPQPAISIRQPSIRTDRVSTSAAPFKGARTRWPAILMLQRHLTMEPATLHPVWDAQIQPLTTLIQVPPCRMARVSTRDAQIQPPATLRVLRTWTTARVFSTTRSGCAVARAKRMWMSTVSATMQIRAWGPWMVAESATVQALYMYVVAAKSLLAHATAMEMCSMHWECVGVTAAPTQTGMASATQTRLLAVQMHPRAITTRLRQTRTVLAR